MYLPYDQNEITKEEVLKQTPSFGYFIVRDYPFPVGDLGIMDTHGNLMLDGFVYQSIEWFTKHENFAILRKQNTYTVVDRDLKTVSLGNKTKFKDIEYQHPNFIVKFLDDELYSIVTSSGKIIKRNRYSAVHSLGNIYVGEMYKETKLIVDGKEVKTFKDGETFERINDSILNVVPNRVNNFVEYLIDTSGNRIKYYGYDKIVRILEHTDTHVIVQNTDGNFGVLDLVKREFIKYPQLFRPELCPFETITTKYNIFAVTYKRKPYMFTLDGLVTAGKNYTLLHTLISQFKDEINYFIFKYFID